MYRLRNVIQNYAWGSRTAIAQLLGQPSPSAGPQAELWIGAHPLGTSRVQAKDETPLHELISSDPNAMLGARCVARFGSRLPMLLKVLASAEPLSLQAHPSMTQAQAGFAEEEARGVPLHASNRNYKDTWHKPELICALTPFDALCGFRPAAETIALLASLHVDALEPYIQALRARPLADGIEHVFRALMTLPADERKLVVQATVEACKRIASQHAPYEAECAWAVRLAAIHPHDIGVVTSLLLNLVVLKPGQAIYMPAGNLHAYLNGVGVEVMASSDNVLRGGLTPKHVDVPELLGVLRFDDQKIELVAPRRANDGEEVFETPASEFRLSRIEVSNPAQRWSATVDGPELLLCTHGSVVCEDIHGTTVELDKGASAFVPDRARSYVARGTATLYRTTLGIRS